MLTLLNTRKSNNPESKIDSKTGMNITSDGRLYYIAEFQDPNNPFSPKREKVIAQQFDSIGNPIWKGGDPSVIKTFVGKQVAGEIVTKQVEAYQVAERIATTYTAVVLAHENVETVFRNAGHPLVDTTTGEVKVAATESTISVKAEPISKI